MNSIETGKLIAKLRKEAGYTQKELADALFVTDKAVSKWERGICNPDANLFTKLAILLNCDVDILIAGYTESLDNKWVGYLLLDNIDVSTMIHDKPLINYMISYFLLVGIKDIYIKTEQEEYVKSLNLKQFGLTISFEKKIFYGKNIMIVYNGFFLFGANLTRQLQNYMSYNETIIPILNNQIIPIIFTHKQSSIDFLLDEAVKKNIGRGMIYIPLNKQEQITDASEFVRIYQKNHNMMIADLNEICINRGIKMDSDN